MRDRTTKDGNSFVVKLLLGTHTYEILVNLTMSGLYPTWQWQVRDMHKDVFTRNIGMGRVEDIDGTQDDAVHAAIAHIWRRDWLHREFPYDRMHVTIDGRSYMIDVHVSPMSQLIEWQILARYGEHDFLVGTAVCSYEHTVDDAIIMALSRLWDFEFSEMTADS